MKKIIKISIFLICILVIAVLVFVNSLKPTYKGDLKLNTLKERVTVFYDDFGVPHINAQNEHDAFTAFGYVHAQDRLWQMEIMRRIAAGRLSELFGEDLIEVDKFMSGLNIEEEAVNTIKKLDVHSESYKLGMAYLNGINQFIEEGVTPLEFHLLGIEKEKYTLKDVYNVFGYMSFSFAAAYKIDPLLTEIKEKFGEEYVKELGVPISNTTAIKTTKK